MTAIEASPSPKVIWYVATLSASRAMGRRRPTPNPPPTRAVLLLSKPPLLKVLELADLRGRPSAETKRAKTR